MNNNYSVYMHKNKANGKVYIGITSRKPEKRWLSGHGYKQNAHFENAIRKYGWDNFEHIILFSNLSKEEAEQKEIELIAEHNATNKDFGYNLANGGNSIGKHTEETRKKISESHIGILHSEETKKKLSEMFKGRKLPKEWAENKRLAQIGIKRTKETCKKISDSESIPVICINTRIIYKSLTDASKRTNTMISHISSCCNKKRPRAGTSENGDGLFWMFYSEYISEGLETKSNEEIIPKLKKVCKQRPIKCIETGIVYSCNDEAHNKTGIPKSSISSCLTGKYKTAGKLHWEYADVVL